MVKVREMNTVVVLFYEKSGSMVMIEHVYPVFARDWGDSGLNSSLYLVQTGQAMWRKLIILSGVCYVYSMLQLLVGTDSALEIKRTPANFTCRSLCSSSNR